MSIVFVIILVYFFVWISYYNRTISNINLYFMNDNVNLFKQTVTEYVDNDIVPILLAICIFEIGSRVKISFSKTINFVAGAVFIIYLIHDTSLFRQIWRERDWITTLYYEPQKFCLLLITYMMVTFAIGFLAYLLFLLLKKGCSTKVFKKLTIKTIDSRG